MSVIERSIMEHFLPTMMPHTPSSQRSVSDVPSLSSSCSSSSSISTLSTPDENVGRIARRPRGFLRPKATRFSDSARNRESVMSLGSITHIQHYFARTGLLDGKGAQAAQVAIKDTANDSAVNSINVSHPSIDNWLDCEDTSVTTIYREPIVEEASAIKGKLNQQANVLQISPTISTYRHAPLHVPAPPTIEALRRELREALADAKSALKGLTPQATSGSEVLPSSNPSQGWYEIEGLHILDLVTLAIRAAKEFYLLHDRPQVLHSIKSERQMRLDLYGVLDVLKRVAGRTFAGGYRKEEVDSITNWIHEVEVILDREETAQRIEQTRREEWTWLNGDWEGRQRYREWLFLKSFESKVDEDPLPAWDDPIKDADQPQPFLSKLRDGKKLITLHNAIVECSTRRFGQITKFHQDTDKPYRRSENIKFWMKGAELRFETKLEVDVAKLVSTGDFETWKKFDEALMKWCGVVRKEITTECIGSCIA